MRCEPPHQQGHGRLASCNRNVASQLDPNKNVNIRRISIKSVGLAIKRLLSRRSVPTIVISIFLVTNILFAFCGVLYNHRWIGWREIHDACSIPWSILEIFRTTQMSMKPGMTSSSMGLARLAACKHNTASGMIVVEPMNGLANRLRALASAAALARRHDRHVIVLWRADVHCEARFRTLFELSNDSAIFAVFDTTSALTLPKISTGKDCSDNTWNQWEVHDAMQKTLALRQHAATLKMTAERKHAFVRSSSVLNVEPALPWRAANAELGRLRPVRRIRHRIASLTPRLKGSVCMHIRHVSLSRDIVGVAESEYGTTDATITAFWRNASSPSVFSKEAARLIGENAKLGEVFVAADSASWVGNVRAKMAGLANVWSLADAGGVDIRQREQACESRSEQCVEDALVDLLCLARCAVFIGSPWSSFTEVAARLRGERVRLAGIDFAQVTAASLGGVSPAVKRMILKAVSAKARKFKGSGKN